MTSPPEGAGPGPAEGREDSIDRRVGTEVGGRYRILATVATGGMGVIYRGERLQLGRPVAIKFLHRQVARDPEFLDRFALEARAMSRMSSPHCVSVIDFGVEEGAPYLVMDYVDGLNLGELLRHGPVNPDRALPICRQILEGLAHAHKQGIVHRDIKPDNIILTAHTGFGDFVRILDFGLAKLTQTESHGRNPTAPGIALGTPSYMSPEQTLAEKLDARSDLYSTGVVLHELLTGKRPFRARAMGEVFKLHREAAPPRLSSSLPGMRFSAELEALVQRALAKTPGGRFQSALEMAGALDSTPEGRRTAAPRLGVPVPDGAADFEPLRPAAPASPPAPTVALPVHPEGAPRGETSGTWVGRLRQHRRRMLAYAAAGILATAGGLTWLAGRHPPAALDDPAGTGTLAAPAGADGAAAGVPATEGRAPPELADPQLRDEPRAGSGAAEVAPVEASAPGDSALLGAQLQPIERMIEAGQHRPAIVGLLRLRRIYPRSARVHYLLGTVYGNKQWWTDAFQAYRRTLRLDPGYRGDLVLRRHLVQVSQKSRRSAEAARRLLAQLGPTR